MLGKTSQLFEFWPEQMIIFNSEYNGLHKYTIRIIIFWLPYNEKNIPYLAYMKKKVQNYPTFSLSLFPAILFCGEGPQDMPSLQMTLGQSNQLPQMKIMTVYF